jgi:hypothetical protein
VYTDSSPSATRKQIFRRNDRVQRAGLLGQLGSLDQVNGYLLDQHDLLSSYVFLL